MNDIGNISYWETRASEDKERLRRALDQFKQRVVGIYELEEETGREIREWTEVLDGAYGLYLQSEFILRVLQEHEKENRH